jgi:hypothetical protein
VEDWLEAQAGHTGARSRILINSAKKLHLELEDHLLEPNPDWGLTPVLRRPGEFIKIEMSMSGSSKPVTSETKTLLLFLSPSDARTNWCVRVRRRCSSPLKQNGHRLLSKNVAVRIGVLPAAS